MSKQRHVIHFVGLLALTALLYGRALPLPFFFDDLDHLPYIARTPLTQIWQSAGGFPYFRPLGATSWRLSYLLFNGHHPIALHALNLLLHALNGWLVGRLAAQLWADGAHTRQTAVASLASILFILFPFSYQAIPWVGALYHLLVTTLVLTAVVSYQQWHTTQQTHWLHLSLIAACLAPFAHENGLITTGLILTLALSQPSASFRTLLWYTLPPLLWLPIWSFAPKARTASDFALNNLETIGQNTAYFGQGTAFPATWVGGWLTATRGWNDLATAVVLTLIALILAFLIAIAQPQIRPKMRFALLWSLFASLPALLLLDFAYVISAPRLLMLASVGAALFWAFVWGAGLQWATQQAGWRRTAGTLTLISFSACAILPAAHFIHSQMDQHDQLGRIWWQLVALVDETQASGQTALFLNFPSSLANPTPTYPLGHEGTVFSVSYIPPQRIYEVNRGRTLAAPLRFRRYDDIRPAMPYLYDVLDVGQDWPALLAENRFTAVFNTRYTPQRIWLEPVGGWPAPQPTSKPLATFPDAGLALLDGSHTAVVSTQNQAIVTLHWAASHPLSYEWNIFVHLLDKQTGQLIAQADGQALANTYTLGQWSTPLTLWEQRYIPLPAGVPPQSLTTAVGLYNWQTGERLPIQISGQNQPTTAVILPTHPQ